MRVTRWSLWLVGCLLLALLTADTALTQWGGGRRRGGRGGPPDPSFMFNRYSNGKDYIVIAEQQRERDKTAMTDYAQRKGISNGRLTREQFADYWQERMASRFSNRGGPSLYIESSPSLAELDKRATVYRVGHLPPELQRTWFEEYDTDKDGQVGLYEWTASGKSVAEFRAMDTNGDGFVTAEEALRFRKKNPGAFASAGPSGRGSTTGGGAGGLGRGGRSFGRGSGTTSAGDPNNWRSRMGRGRRGPRPGTPGSP